MTKRAAEQPLDRDLFALYLNDHLAGAAAGLARATRMAEEYRDLPGHAVLTTLSQELRAERARLVEVVDSLGMGPSALRAGLARLGERLGQLKLNRRALHRSPMTPLLEVELLRGAVNAKAGVWEVLEYHANDLGLEAREWRDLAAQARRQAADLAHVHEQLRASAFLQDSPLEA